jgi:hypothetical protein
MQLAKNPFVVCLSVELADGTRDRKIFGAMKPSMHFRFASAVSSMLLVSCFFPLSAGHKLPIPPKNRLLVAAKNGDDPEFGLLDAVDAQEKEPVTQKNRRFPGGFL